MLEPGGGVLLPAQQRCPRNTPGRPWPMHRGQKGLEMLHPRFGSSRQRRQSEGDFSHAHWLWLSLLVAAVFPDSLPVPTKHGTTRRRSHLPLPPPSVRRFISTQQACSLPLVRATHLYPDLPSLLHCHTSLSLVQPHSLPLHFFPLRHFCISILVQAARLATGTHPASLATLLP